MMKKLILYLLLSGLNIVYAAGTPTQYTTDNYRAKPLPGEAIIQLPFDFSGSHLKAAFPDSLKSQTITRVDLVYSKNAANPDFAQTELNQKRIQTLKQQWSTSNDERITWNTIEQTNTTNAQTARKLFHGFTIYYRPNPTEASISAELDYIDAFIHNTEENVAALTPSAPSGIEAIPKEHVVRDVVEVTTDSTYTTIGSIVFSSGAFWPNYLTMKNDYSIVKRVFNRHPQWQNTSVVMDVTGSMSPYIAQTMAWLKDAGHNNQVRAFTFFNDGDGKPDKLKITGHVGGIYSTPNTDFESVYNEMRQTMRKGGGGDCPENNLEAVLKAKTSFPTCDEMVLVADNWASPRDLALIKQLDTPVHIILCGAITGINMDYIQLAYDTGGSIHTIEDDLKSRDITPGKTFQIGQHYFTLFEGRIIHAKNKA